MKACNLAFSNALKIPGLGVSILFMEALPAYTER